jgi:hypothetical protein
MKKIEKEIKISKGSAREATLITRKIHNFNASEISYMSQLVLLIR